MQTVLEQGSIDKPLTFDIGLIQLSFIPVCSLNTCNISVKLCRGFAALQCFFFIIMVFFICYFLYLQKRSKVNKKNAQELTSVFSPTLFVITVNLCPYPNSHYYNHFHHSLLPCLTTAQTSSTLIFTSSELICSLPCTALL